MWLCGYPYSYTGCSDATAPLIKPSTMKTTTQKKHDYSWLALAIPLLIALIASGAFTGVFGQTIQPKLVKDTTINGTKFTIYEGKKGGKFIQRTSATGKQYRQYISSMKHYNAPAVDLPEEWMTISTDINKPTKLVGYIKDGKLYILFR